jgi:hypothetical protein
VSFFKSSLQAVVIEGQQMATEIDACKVVPGNQAAYDAGKRIGEHAATTGNPGDGWTALSQYTQTLFTTLPKDVSQQERQRIWAAGQKDAIAGMACADPKDFHLVAPTEGSAPRDTQLRQHPEVDSAVNGAFGLLARYNKDQTPIPNALPLDQTIAQVNAFIHNKVEPMGPEALQAFVTDFNARSAGRLDIPNTKITAQLTDDGRRAVIQQVAR